MFQFQVQIDLVTLNFNLMFLPRELVIILFTILMTRVNGRDLSWIKCPVSSTVFYRSYCLYCLQIGQRQLASDSENTLDHFRFNENDTDFAVCHEDSSVVFTQHMVRWGAKSLKGHNLNVVTIQRLPFSEIVENENGINSYRGILFEFLNTIAEKYKFSMRISTPPDLNFGTLHKNGSWNGMIGMVLTKEAELGAASFSITEDRARVVQFTTQFHLEQTGILIPAPTEGDKLIILIKPFSPEVWLGLALSILNIATALYAFHSETLGRAPTIWTRCSVLPKFLSRIWMYIAGSLVQQSVKSPETKLRWIVAIWWMGTIIMANTYLAFLVSSLSVPRLHNLVNSLDELANQRYLQWTFRIGTAHYGLFKSDMSAGIYKTIGGAVSDSDLVQTDFEGLDKVRTGKWAFIKEISFLDVALSLDFESHKECRLTVAKEKFFTVGLGLVVPKGSPYIELLDYEISNAISTGLMEKWKTIYWPKHLECVNAEKFMISTRGHDRKLTLTDVQGAYFLLGSGLAVALIVFFLEFILHRVKLVVVNTRRGRYPPSYLR